MKLTHTFKNSFYLLCLILVGYTAKSQTTVTIGDQNTNYISYYTPFNNYYNYSWADNVYLSSEIGQAGTITKISFYVYEGTNINMSNQSIYMRTTSASSFTNSTYPGTSGFTSVYSGSINYVWNGNSGWQTITLTTPFVYNGTSNLEILTLNNSGAYTNNFEYFNVTTGYSTNRSKMDYYDGSFPSSCQNCGAYSMLTNCQLTLSCSPSTTVTPTTATVCLGTGTSITASGASTYTWSPSTGLNTTSGATVTATPTTTTTYSVASTNSASCVQTNTVTITVNALPSLTITPSSATICAGASTTLTASGATNYTWSPTTGLSSSTSATVTANPTVTTTYTLTGKNSSNCVNTKTVTVTVNPVNTITVTPSSASICIGGNTSLVASGSSSYVWAPGATLNTTTSATVTATPTTTTTYTVTGSCNQTTTVAVTVNALPTLTITASSASICAGNSTTLTATGASTYSWSPTTSLSSSTGASVTASPTATTTYTLTGTNSNGCVNTKTITITVNPLPTLTITPSTATVCAGSSSTLVASGASTYVWSPTSGLNTSTSATVTATPTATTTYTITGTNSNGCVNKNTAVVTVKPINTITVTPSSATICIGNNTSLVASGANAYTWAPGASLNTTSSATVTATPTTTTTYTVTGDCNQTTTVAITVNALPTLTITPSTATVCAGNPTNLTASGASTYSWSPAGSLNTNTGASVTATPTTTTTYTLTGTNSNGCNNTQTAVVTVNPLPTLTITPSSPTICAGASTTLTASGASTYSWSPATGLSTTTGASVTANPTVTTNYTITATNSNGCVGTQTATVNINATPSLTVTPNNPIICNAGSATMTASGASNYSWSPSTGLNTSSGATVISNASSSTIYTVSGTGSDGCLATATATVNLSQVNAGSAVATGGSNLCSNAAVALSVSTANVNQVGTGTNSSEKYPFDGYYNYSWSDVIYLQSDLGSAGTLTSLSFYVNNGPSNFVMNNQDIYIRTTSATSFTNSTYPGTSGFTQVFNGTITYNGTGWKTITLNTPFTYDGTSNLEILYENHDGSWGNGFPTFNYTSGYPVNRAKRDYEDATFPSSCYTCGAFANVPNTQFTFTRTLDNFVKWQSSTDNVNYTDISGGTSQSFNTTANTSTYFRAQMSNGTCTAPSAPAYYVTNNNYYVNDNSTTGDKFCSAIGNSSNDGKDRSRPNTTVNYILTTYTLGPCDTIFVDAGNYTQEVDIYYPEGGNSSGYTTIHGAGIGKTVFTAPSSGLNFYMYQPDYWKIEGFSMNSSQSYANVLMYEATHNVLANNKMTHSAYSNIQVFGDNLSGKSNQFLYNNISNSSTNGNAIDVEGSCDSTLVQGDTITMSNSGSEDAMIFYTYNDGNGNIYYPSHNSVTQNVVSAYSYGVSLYGYDHPISTFTVSNNKITLNTNTITDGAPIWLQGVGSSSTDITYIYNNRLIGGNNGFYLGTTANYQEIYNNYVSNNNYGVYVSATSSNNGQLYFNSFYNSITNLYFAYSSNTGWKVKNNILYTTNTSATNANISVGNGTTFADCNYNLFYAPSGASTARFNSTNYASLTAWQAVAHSAATTHGDENSVSGNPLYNSVTTNNLDLTGSSPADVAGVTITGITTDIYNHTRFTTPNIGAEEEIPVASAGHDTSICFGSSVQLHGGSGLNYSWAPTAGLSSTTIANPIASPTTTTQYTLTVTDGAESTTSKITVTVNPLPTITFTSNPAGFGICLGGQATLTASGANTYSWSPSTSLNTNIGATVTANPTMTTTYSIVGTNTNNCTATQTVVLTVTPLPTLTLISNPSSFSICSGGQATLTASGASTYSWSPSTSLNTNIGATVIANPTLTTTYSIVGTNGNNCTATQTLVLTVNHLALIKGGGTIITCAHDTVILGATASGSNIYTWQPTTGLVGPNNILNPLTSPSVTTIYTLTATDSSGFCSSSIQDTVIIGPYNNSIQLPGFDTIPTADTLYYLIQELGLIQTGIVSSSINLCLNLPNTGQDTVIAQFFGKTLIDTLTITYNVDSTGSISNARLLFDSTVTIPLDSSLYPNSANIR